ncbi:MAG: hypothetical protein HC888_08765 [Candidatus Competibacteraceae bacterium]|nr:hypothetical protein [Candidatus Competibacteraceae bacterium]
MLGLFAFALMGRHRVLVEDKSIFDEWGPTAEPKGLLRAEVELAVELSEEAEAKGTRALHEIIVDDVVTPSWGLKCILSPSQAFSFLGRPLRILLENGRNDGNFLLAFCRQATRQQLEDAAVRGWVDFANAGGIEGLYALGEERAETLLRTFVMCDSDAQSPGKPSHVANKVKDWIAVNALSVQMQPEQLGHMLSARAAENYADCRAVVTWASQRVPPHERHDIMTRALHADGQHSLARNPGGEGTDRRLLICALAWQQLEDEQRRHFDAKKGLEGTNDPALISRLSPFQRAALASGFGGGFSKRFYPQQRELCDSTGEIGALIERVVTRL